MANRLRGEAAFVLDGTEHRIVLDAEAMLNAEDMAGIGLLSLVERLDSIRVLAALLAAGLSSASGKPVGLTAAAEMLLADIGGAPWPQRSQEINFRLVARDTT